MELQIALGTSLTITLGSIERTRSVLTSALEIAERLDDLDAQVRAFWALWALYFDTGECGAAQSVAERFSRVASRTGDPGVISVADRLWATHCNIWTITAQPSAALNACSNVRCTAASARQGLVPL